jgi:hypothetical protein
MRTLFPFLTLVPLLLIVASSATAQQGCVEGSGTPCPDDLIVLSTPGIGDSNALDHGASNETIVVEGANFGDDTIMNFTTGLDN